MTNGWGRDELEASVIAYISMLNAGRRDQKINKAEIYRQLSSRFGRTESAFERRMSNISHVYHMNGREWVKGLKPLSNVGSNVLRMIEELINENDEFSSLPTINFEQSVTKLLQTKNLPKPKGTIHPKKQTRPTSVPERDKHVQAWVIQTSNGICECCQNPAPFIKISGLPGLEVHHVRRLSDGGSDTVSNAVAICPNCHRELHSGENRDQVKEGLYKMVERLVRE